MTDKTLLVDTDLAKEFSVECLASGYFSTLKACKNIDDCHGHNCGPHGTCVDQIEDYTCECKDGFELNILENGEKQCGNVDDCGDNQCGEHGSCVALVNSYLCQCNAGYDVVELPAPDGGAADQTCRAKVCPELSPIHNSAMPEGHDEAHIAGRYPKSFERDPLL